MSTLNSGCLHSINGRVVLPMEMEMLPPRQQQQHQQIQQQQQSADRPPTYDEAVVAAHIVPAIPSLNPNAAFTAPPPSYDSLYGRVRAARKHSNGILDYIKNVFVIFLGTIGCTIFLGITIFIPITMVCFGLAYLNHCPAGEFIPVYLLIGGIMGLIKPVLNLSTFVRQSEEDQQLEQMRQSGTQSVINWFMFGWFIIGSYWIYRIYEPNYDPANGLYCNHNLYTFAFWLVSSVYIVFGVITSVLIVISIISVIINKHPITRTEVLSNNNRGSHSNRNNNLNNV